MEDGIVMYALRKGWNSGTAGLAAGIVQVLLSHSFFHFMLNCFRRLLCVALTCDELPVIIINITVIVITIIINIVIIVR